jgi:hypothetical protein
MEVRAKRERSKHAGRDFTPHTTHHDRVPPSSSFVFPLVLPFELIFTLHLVRGKKCEHTFATDRKTGYIYTRPHHHSGTTARHGTT